MENLIKFDLNNSHQVLCHHTTAFWVVLCAYIKEFFISFHKTTKSISNCHPYVYVRVLDTTEKIKSIFGINQTLCSRTPETHSQKKMVKIENSLMKMSFFLNESILSFDIQMK